MEKVILSKAQLQELINYVNRSGFREPSVVLEILDHFACKVEEIMTEHSDYPLDLAMVLAHESFGLKGFHPIAEQYRKHIQRKYKRLYRDQLKALYGHIGYLIFALILGFCFYKAFVWTVFHPINYICTNDFLLLLDFTLIISYIGLRFKLWRMKRKDLIASNILALNNAWFVPFTLNTFAPYPGHVSELSFKLICFSVFFSAVFVWYVFAEIAFYKLSRQALRDMKALDAEAKAVLG